MKFTARKLVMIAIFGALLCTDALQVPSRRLCRPLWILIWQVFQNC